MSGWVGEVSDWESHLSQRCLLARSRESWRSFSFERRSLIVAKSEGWLERVGMGGVETLREGVRGVASGIVVGKVVSIGGGC